MPTTLRTLAGAGAGLTIAAGAPAGVQLGLVNDFEDGLNGGWIEGGPSPNPPFVIPTGGPDGEGDAFLRNLATGGADAGSIQVMFNKTDAWIGDYLSAGVGEVRAFMANLGENTLHMRLAIEGGNIDTWGSSTAAVLPPDGVWREVAFPLADLAPINADEPLEAALGDVITVRILSAEFGPDWMGDPVASVLGVDDLTMAPPTPACPADVTADGVVDSADLNALLADFGCAGPACAADVNADGATDSADLNLVLAAFGSAC